MHGPSCYEERNDEPGLARHLIAGEDSQKAGLQYKEIRRTYYRADWAPWVKQCERAASRAFSCGAKNGEKVLVADVSESAAQQAHGAHLCLMPSRRSIIPLRTIAVCVCRRRVLATSCSFCSLRSSTRCASRRTFSEMASRRHSSLR
eukprot:1281119-Pleurochrysis_carterae.AAC.7